MINGLLLTLPNDFPRQRLAELLVAFLPETHDIQVGQVAQRNQYHFQIILKSIGWPLRIRELLSEEGDKTIQLTERHLCHHDGCFAQTVASQFPLLAKEDHFTLFDRYAEEPHGLHSYCRTHASILSLSIAHTLQIENVTPVHPCFWDKIATWKLRGHYFGQRVYLAAGDLSVGIADYQSAYPWAGPFASRKEAIEACRCQPREEML